VKASKRITKQSATDVMAAVRDEVIHYTERGNYSCYPDLARRDYAEECARVASARLNMTVDVLDDSCIGVVIDGELVSVLV
jgi:hypothetical protein